MSIKRYLVLVAVLVVMGLATVWWKTRTLAMGYETVRLEEDLARVVEEVRVEDSALASLTCPVRVDDRREVQRLNLARAPSYTPKSRRRGADSRQRLYVAHR